MSAPEYIALRVGLAGHQLISEARNVSGRDRALVVAVLLEVIEAGLKAADRGDLSGLNVQEIADRYSTDDADVLAVLDALRVVGLINARLGPGYTDLHRVRFEEGEE